MSASHPTHLQDKNGSGVEIKLY